jgi:UTP--glucose-1-phosphate uridylyltransferase
MPGKGTVRWREAFERGSEACREGSIAVLILNGGMATRFSGVVKGIEVRVLGRSFLSWKLEQVRSLAPSVPVFLMNSPFTNDVTLEHLGRLGGLGEGVHTFVQSVYPRKTVDGEPFLDEEGKPSMAGRGHGDMLECFRESGMLDRFQELGCRSLMVSNVDNLGAMLDPVALGMHLGGGRGVTIEVTRRKPSHKGGIIASVRGIVQVFEGLRWPEGLDLEPYLYFNTNTFYLGEGVLASPPRLPLHRVIKEVQGRKVVQMEKILGEISQLLPSQFLVVSDEGEESRFIPIKTPDELESSLGSIRLVLGKWNLQE